METDSMKWKVLVSAPYLQQAMPRFQSFFQEHGIETVVPPVNERLEEHDLLRWAADVDGVIAGDDRFTERVLQAASKLRVISKWGTGIDSIDRDACRRLGIAVRNTPNAFSEAVADTVMGYLLCFSRNLVSQDRQMKAGAWKKIPGRTLRECTLGVIGVGNAGKAVVQRAAGFGMQLLGNDPVVMPVDFLMQTRIQMVKLSELLEKADFVSLNCDLNPTSYHLMSDGQFALMRAGAVLINTARGPVVDEPALVRALETGRLGGAALDVFEDEPLPAGSPLRGFDNVLLAPHNANSSPAAWERVHQNTLHNLLEELRRKDR
jgi:D-3-phosphoglycerate dehydrogenase